MFKALKSLSLYSFGEVLNKSIQFLLLPLYTNYLSPADYGKLELTYLYGGILVIFYGFIIENGYGRLFFDKTETDYRNKLFGTSFFFKFFTGLLFLALSVLLADELANALFKFENGATYIILISVSIFIKSLAEIPLKTLIVEKRAKRYIINNFVYLLVSLSSTIYFIVGLNLNVVGVLYGQILGAVVQLVSLLFTEWKQAFFSFSMPLLKGMFYFSLFMIPSQLASFVTYWSNRLFLQEHTSLEDIGTFSFGYKVASIISILLTGPIKKAVGPEVYELIDNPEECKKRIRQFTLVTLLVLTFSSLALSVFSREIIMLVASKDYASSHEFVFILSMGYVIIGIAGIIVLPINITKKTWLITLTWVLSSGVNIALNYYLIANYGSAGATYATLFTFLFITSLYFVFSETVYKVRFEYGKYIFIITIASLAYYCSMHIETRFIFYNLIFKTIILCVTLIILYKSVITKEERAKIIKMLGSKIPVALRTKAAEENK